MATPNENMKKGRLLRIASDSHDTEDRVPIFTKSLSRFKDWKDLKQMESWVNRDASRKTVLQALGLTGLKGFALRYHHNYNRFLEFLSKREDKRFTRMIANKVTTTSIWQDYKLMKLSELGRTRSRKFQFYMRYAKAYDDDIFLKTKSYSGTAIYYGGTPDEMHVLAGLWASAGRPNDYVKWVLNLENAPRRKLRENPYYQEFLSLQNPKKWNSVTEVLS
ncbi:Avirulence (Avh) protein [Phytophthora megakarya]|uniref:Avirulence (Avh) protein n=1 Tax=Phytophthora megakarya TaxID=4795 RepID=A0A225VFZ8_9STRA|nr:Avirulence (Avh) protein [Phytophthora megakarya]